MNITVIGSHLCPDTLLALCKLREAGIDVDFKNLSASLPDLSVRESDPLYEAVRKNGGIGIPCFVFEDGRRTLNLDEVLSAH